MPLLQLLFSVDTINKKVIDFIIHQLLCVVPVRETFVDMELESSNGNPKTPIICVICEICGTFILCDLSLS